MDNNETSDDHNQHGTSSQDAEPFSDSAGPDSRFEEDVNEELTGIIYISRIPPYMGLSKLRSYFSNFGKVGKIYCHPESIGEYNKRVKLGGNKRLKFTHGWIQFLDKKVAKSVANLLNNRPVLDKKRHSFWREDLWNIKYLPKFKWRHLVEYWSSNKRDRREKLHAVLSKERKRNFHYLEQLELEKREFNMENKRKMKENKGDQSVQIKKRYKKVDNIKKTKGRKEQKKEVPVELLNSIVL